MAVIPGIETWPPRLARLAPALICPACRRELAFSAAGATCGPCDARYPLHAGRLFFQPGSVPDDHTDRWKDALKRRLGRLYYWIGVTLVAPTFPCAFARLVRQRLNPKEVLVVDLGCGNNRLDPDIVGVDIAALEAVDVVADLARLPLAPQSVDAIVSRSVLEHLPEPGRVVGHARAATRSDGLGIHLVPFLYPFHASPHDYQRWTHQGLRQLFAGFRVQEIRNATGPATLFVLVLTETFGCLAACLSERLRPLAYLAACLLFWPFKFLDFPFVGRKAFLTLAPSLFLVVRRDVDAK